MPDNDKAVRYIENMPSGLEVALVDDGAILHIRASSMSRDSVDAFWEQAGAYWKDRQDNNAPFLYLYQVEQITLSPYSRQVGIERIKQFQEVHGRIAMTFNRRNPLVMVIRNYVMREMARGLPQVEIKEFSNNDDALLWLRSYHSGPQG